MMASKWGLFPLRAVVGIVFLMHGAQKFFVYGIDGTTRAMEGMGVPFPGISAVVVAAMTHPDVRHTPTFADAVAVLHENIKAPAVIVIMSAGDAPDIGVQYLKLLQEAS